MIHSLREIAGETHLNPTESKARIVQSAQAVFAQNGYDGTSLKMIAQRVGVSTPALDWHLKSKDELYLAAIESMLVDFLDAVRGSVRSSEPPARFGEYVAAHVRFQLERRDEAGVYAQTVGMRTLTHSLPPELRDTIVALQRSYVDDLRRILLAGREQGDFSFNDVRVTAFAVITLCEYVHAWFTPDGPLSVDDVVDHYVKLAVRMVGGRPPTPKPQSHKMNRG
jgi:TetR/AcrR family transcriptional regulator, cholesterol catabolism regulator